MSAFGTLSVTKFNTFVRDIFSSEELLHNVKIVGEVFGVSNARGTTYFSLKDEQSSLPCVVFGREASVREGQSVIVTGSPNFYVKGGRFNFVVSKIEDFGEGLLMQKFLELKAKLEREGLFDQNRKKPLPKSIKRIGVVTSREGAVIQDIKNVAWRRCPSVDIVLFNTKVQGNGAENEIADGIRFFSEYDGVDVVVVARGGGSLEDLSAFNTEIVARAAADCKKPLVSAVGHETDFTIIDFVSDLRAPTPSAAAELLTRNSDEEFSALRKDIFSLSNLLTQTISENNFVLQADKDKLFAVVQNSLQKNGDKLEKLTMALRSQLTETISKKDFSLKILQERIKHCNPLDILSLGYAKIEQQGKNVGKLNQLDLEKPIEINFVDGMIEVKTK